MARNAIKSNYQISKMTASSDFVTKINLRIMAAGSKINIVVLI